MNTLLKNCLVFDGSRAELYEDAYIVIENDRVKELGTGTPTFNADRQIDCEGKFVMPGLIDAHFHAYTPSFNMRELDQMPPTLLAAHAAIIVKGALNRGFTTVRDAAGGDVGLAKAIEMDLIEGPRFFYSGKGISQTGGHGDMRPGDENELCGCTFNGTLTMVADGEDGVRKAAREELRKGATQVKVFVSGGVISPTDPIWMRQFTDAEIKACVEEAASRRTYVMAHCHTADSARRCAELGIRTIEHGTQIDDATAQFIAAKETYVVPTLSVFDVIQKNTKSLSLPPASDEKILGVCDRALASIEACQRAGVKLGFGTDLLDHRFHPLQGVEFVLRGQVSSPLEVLRSATSVNAEVLRMEGQLGCISEGAYADIVVVEGNPLEDLSVLADPQEKMPLIMRGGELIKNQIH